MFSHAFKEKKAHAYWGGIQIHSVHAQQLQKDTQRIFTTAENIQEMHKLD